MSNKRFFSFAVAASLCAGFGQLLAAEPFAQITALKGDAMVDRGAGFIAASQGMDLQQLDRVIVLEQGEAMIEFQDGCKQQMNELDQLTLGSKSTCKSKGTDYQAVRQTATSQVPTLSLPALTGPTLGAAVVGGVGLTAVVVTEATTDTGEATKAIVSTQ